MGKPLHDPADMLNLVECLLEIARGILDILAEPSKCEDGLPELLCESCHANAAGNDTQRISHPDCPPQAEVYAYTQDI